MSEPYQRRLAAVMFTDIVDSTTLVNVNVLDAIDANARHRRVLESSVPAHNGQLLQYQGDGSLSIFPSAVEAAFAALEIQHAVQTEPPGLPLRIGIAEGEIAFEDEQPIGPAVNLAHRIQSLGKAGAVLVSDKVFDELENQPAIIKNLVGEFRLQGIPRPVRVYALELPGRRSDDAAAAPLDPGLALIRKLNEAFEPEYKVESQLDAEGVGVVVAARDVVLERPVAIKAIRPDLATAGTVEEFLRRARILANLKHPNIIPVHRAGTARGYPYYVMDLVAGETLAERLQHGLLPPAVALPTARALLDALSAAHDRGLIHGDVHSGNILFVGDGVVLSGFGLSGRGPRPAPARAAAGSPRPHHVLEPPADAPVTVQDDIYAVGTVLYEMLTGGPWQPGMDPEKANWTGVPRRLVRPLRGALALAPDRRWSSAAHFRRALFRPPIPVPVGRLGSLALVAIVAGYIVRTYACAPSLPVDAAILPFQAQDPADSEFAAHLTTMTAGNLEFVPRLVMTPIEAVWRWWERADPGQRDDRRVASRMFGAEYLVHGFLLSRRDSVEVQLVLTDSLERQVSPGRVSFRVLRSDLTAAANRVALEILKKLPRVSDELPPRSSPDFDALVSFLNGERARYGGNWERAAEHYQAALQRDSLFAEARWQLVNVWRWMPGRTPPLRAHLEKLAAAGTEDLSPVHRLLVQAQLAPAGEQRLSRYAEAVALNPRDAYAALLYGEELFHRGALAGRAADSATKWLESAARWGANLAPTHELLVWHYVRLGNRTGAQRAVVQLKKLFDPEAQEAVAYADLLEQAYLEKFDPSEATRRRAIIFGGSTPRALAQLDFAVRAGLAFHLPEVQLEMGKVAANHNALDRVGRANGHIAQALAHAILGRGAAALVQFDSAVVLDPTPEYRLMAAQWRVLPGSLGYDLMPEAEREYGLAELHRLATDPLAMTRALWSLALYGYLAGASASARQYREQLASIADSTARRLLAIVDAFRLAAADSPAAALGASEPLFVHDAGGEHGDPFARTALHLGRGGWLERAGDARQAQLAWLWAENTDIRPWLGGSVQAAEVDWVFGPYAAYLRGLNALEEGDRKGGCVELARVLHDWARPEAGVRALSATAAQAYNRSCR